MSLTRKHFKELAVMLADGDASKRLVDEMISFCYKHNGAFSKERFLDAIEERKAEREKRRIEMLIENSANPDREPYVAHEHGFEVDQDYEADRQAWKD